jgi:hypothetical protein
MRIRSFSILALGFLALGCSSPRTAFDARMKRGHFAFVMGQGSAWHGYDVLRIAANGECWFTFSELDYGTEHVVWRESHFEIPKEMLRDLKAQLNDVGFFALQDAYRGPSGHEHSQWFFKVRIGERKKSVMLDNEFPAPVVRLEHFISENVLDPHRAEFKTAQVIAPEPEVGADAF